MFVKVIVNVEVKSADPKRRPISAPEAAALAGPFVYGHLAVTSAAGRILRAAGHEVLVSSADLAPEEPASEDDTGAAEEMHRRLGIIRSAMELAGIPCKVEGTHERAPFSDKLFVLLTFTHDNDASRAGQILNAHGPLSPWTIKVNGAK